MIPSSMYQKFASNLRSSMPCGISAPNGRTMQSMPTAAASDSGRGTPGLAARREAEEMLRREATSSRDSSLDVGVARMSRRSSTRSAITSENTRGPSGSPCWHPSCEESSKSPNLSSDGSTRSHRIQGTSSGRPLLASASRMACLLTALKAFDISTLQMVKSVSRFRPAHRRLMRCATLCDPPTAPTPNWGRPTAAATLSLMMARRIFPTKRRKISPTAIGRIPPCFLRRAVRAAPPKNGCTVALSSPFASLLHNVVRAIRNCPVPSASTIC